MKDPIKVKKISSTLKKVDQENIIGHITISLELNSTRRPITAPPVVSAGDTFGGGTGEFPANNNHNANTMRPNDFPAPPPYYYPYGFPPQPIIIDKSDLQAQMLVYVERVQRISSRPAIDNPFRNLYVSFKMYGTTVVVKSPVRQRTNTPFIDHKTIMPVSYDSALKMEKVPLILEIWDQDETQKSDSLVGITKVSLVHAADLLLDKNTSKTLEIYNLIVR
jgi:hypothetical protein